MYTRYAENYIEAKCALEELLTDQEVVKHFKSSKTKLFKEAMQYILPNSLLEPVYHFFYYFEVMDVSHTHQATPINSCNNNYFFSLGPDAVFPDR